jgi:hypothetical protein
MVASASDDVAFKVVLTAKANGTDVALVWLGIEVDGVPRASMTYQICPLRSIVAAIGYLAVVVCDIRVVLASKMATVSYVN